MIVIQLSLPEPDIGDGGEMGAEIGAGRHDDLHEECRSSIAGKRDV